MSPSRKNPPQRRAATPRAAPPSSAGSDVDVIVTTRNDGPILCDLLKQLPVEGIHELFIVDDGSTDVGTVGILKGLEDGGYHVVRQDQWGLSRARNEGARVSRAPFLLYLDPGTVPLEGFLADASSRLHDDSTVAAVLADGRWRGGEAIVVSEVDPSSVVAALHSHWFALLRRTAIEKVGGWDERLETGQDRDLFMSLAETGWSFAKLPSKGFTKLAGAEEPVRPPEDSVVRTDGIRIAEKHREFYAEHFAAIIGAYEAALATAGERLTDRRSLGVERTVHDLMDQLAAVRSDLARSEADGVRARSTVADVDRARLEAEHRADEARLEAEHRLDAARLEAEHRLEALRLDAERRAQEEAQLLQERIGVLDREIAALYATKTLRLLRIPRRLYEVVSTWLR